MTLLSDRPWDTFALAKQEGLSDPSGSASAADPKPDGRRIRREAALAPWPSVARDSAVLRARLDGAGE